MVFRYGVPILFLLLPFLSFAQSQNSEILVVDNGMEVFLPDSIKAQLNDGSASVKSILLQWLSADGYLNASIDSVREDAIYLNKNCRFDLYRLKWNYAGEIDSVHTQYPEVSYQQQILKDEMEQRLFELTRQGFPFSEATIKDFKADHLKCQVDVTVDINPGEKAKALDIFFTGNETNSSDYLRKISRFRSGQIITPDYQQFLRANLLSSGLFNEVSGGEVFLREGEPVIVFNVQERSLNQFNGLLGYVPDAAGSGQIVGDVELSLWNVITEGNGFDLRYQRLRPETSQLNVGISQDWIETIPVGLSAGFQLYQNDTTYQTRDFDLEGYYRINPVIKLIGGIGFQSATSGNDGQGLVEPDGEKRTARLGFEYSNLNRFDVPTAGSSVRLTFEIANKDIAADSAVAFTQNILELSLQNYIPVFERSVIASSLNGFLLESDRITVNDLIRFGGANSFRGYAEEQFRAGQLFWGDLEYRFLLDRSSYIFAFTAAGRYHRPRLLTENNNDFRITKTLYSTGFGLSYQTQIGRLKFTYAVSPEESIANGKVHFGIRTKL